MDQVSKISALVVVWIVIIFYGEVHVLTVLKKYQIPPLRQVNPKDITIALYGLWDKSGSGYRIFIKKNQNKGPHLEYLM